MNARMLRTLEQPGHVQQHEHQPFWRPLLASPAVADAQPTERLWQAEQEEQERTPGKTKSASLSFAAMREALGQTRASMTALLCGGACMVAAVMTGFIFTANTLLDWQAIQLWRIEWLLAAVGLFAAGNLLKKK